MSKTPRAVRRRALAAFTFEGRRCAVPKTFIARFLREKTTSLREYTIVRVARPRAGYGNSPEAAAADVQGIYFDAPYNFILCNEKRAVAVIGFDAADGDFSAIQEIRGVDALGKPTPKKKRSERDRAYPESTLVVRQIQGTKGMKAALTLLRWEKLLLAVLVEWALTHGFEEIRVPCAETIFWYKARSDEIKTTFRIRYNATPLRMGFRLSDDGAYAFLRKCGGSPP